MASPLSTDPPHFAMPEGPAARLGQRPRLEVWAKSGDPELVRLHEFLHHARDLVRPAIDAHTSVLALRLDIGLDDSIDPLHQRDLDNYLFPLTRWLSQERFLSVWATKARFEPSLLRVEPAQPAGPLSGWKVRSITTEEVPRSEAWKREISIAFDEEQLLPPGPVALQVSFLVSSAADWAELWKPAIDALDPILGRTYREEEWDPRDGRIVRLGLHCAVDEDLGERIGLRIAFRPAPLDWPELRWLAAMTEEEREAYLRRHEETYSRLPPRRKRGRRGKRRAALSGAGIIELTSIEEFERALGSGNPLLIYDIASGAKLHPTPASCSGIRREWFVAKVITGARKNGAYYTVTDRAAAREHWSTLRTCASCG